MPTAAIALGSNLGDRQAHLEHARARLAALLAGARFSRALETLPEDVPDRQPPFLNAAAVGETALTARDLLEVLLEIEHERGREREQPRAARTLDLDLVLFGDAIVSEAGLIVPHPRFRERGFVLEPLAEIAPDLRDPVTGETVAALLAQFRRSRPGRAAPRP